MNQIDFFRIHSRHFLADEKKLRADVRNQMMFRYGIIGFAMLFLFLFRDRLPFPFPHFFLVACGDFVANTVLHLATFNKRLQKKTYGLFPYIDALIAPFVFMFTGGFLSPFVISHIATNIGSAIVYTENRLLALHSFLILLTGYLSVAFLQKTGILPVHVDYSRIMIGNDFFFAFVIVITSLIIIASYVLIHALNARVHQMLDEMSSAFDSILKGTSSVIGQDFFIRLAKHCAERLSVRCVMVGELINKRQTFRTLVIWKDGAIAPNREWAVPGSVFSSVLQQEQYSTAHAEPSVFPQDTGAAFVGSLLKDSGGKPIGMFCIVHEGILPGIYLANPLIAIFASRTAAELERKQSEDKRKQTELLLSQAQKMEALGQLMSGITHDFNNMLGIITGYAKLLSEELASNPALQRYAQQIFSSGSRTSDLIGRLAQFVRRDKPQQAPVDVHAVIDETVGLLERTLPKKISLVKQFAAPPVLSRGDSTLLQNVFMNLAINARDAMEEKEIGTLTFSTSVMHLKSESTLCQAFRISPGDYIAVGVTDSGCGMNDEVLSRVFEPFFTTKAKGKGTGLGLANVWGYIETFKGAIEVKSRENLGSTFTLYLPMIKGGAPQLIADGACVGKVLPAPEERSVLVVDDEAVMRELAHEMLMNNGFSVTACGNGAEAVNYLKNNPGSIDLVLLDMIMPEMSGHDAFYEIRKVVPDMKIILTSGLIDEEQLKAILGEPRAVFLRKPFSEERLMQEITTLSAKA